MSDRAFVTLKLATSLDGRIATASGESRWITGAAARAEVHRLRAAHDAVLVGIGTALADDPELTARTDPPPERQPVRVVLDSRARLAIDSRLVKTLPLGPVWAFVDADAEASALQAAGVRVERLSAGPRDLAEVLRRLAAGGVARVFVEGGGGVAAAFVAGDFVDALEWFRAPMLLGGDGLPALGPLGLATLNAAKRFRRLEIHPLGDDVWERYQRIEP